MLRIYNPGRLGRAPMSAVGAVIVLVACTHAALYSLVCDRVSSSNFTGRLQSVSYAPFGRADQSDLGGRASIDIIRADLKLLAPLSRAIRTYSSTGGVELVPGIAAEFGMDVTAGAWIGRNKEQNEREITSVIDVAMQHSNVSSIVVGNETIFRDDVKIGTLIELIQRVRSSVSVPVTTGEIWSVWRDHPELVAAVDYIAVHILPYWQGVSEKGAVEAAIGGYEELRRLYPNKRIVIAEFGWPSAGYNFKSANPGRIEQALVLRQFVSRAEVNNISYNIVEAFDQPWKVFEGGVGPYWGLYDTSRRPKFEWEGTITGPDYWQQISIGLILSILISLPIVGRSLTLRHSVVIVAAANVAGAWFAAVFEFWSGHYFVLGAALAFGFGILLSIPLAVIAYLRIEEAAAIIFGCKVVRLIGTTPTTPDSLAAKVSIHIPAHNELPHVLKQTLDAVAQLDYQNIECVLVINNTTDPAMWMPVEEHCHLLGDRFKFVRAENLSGFKAGALRLAMAHTAIDVEVIGVIDADYVVHKDWLKNLMPMFNDPRVGMVQAPQDHRDGERSVIHCAMNGEYAAFFDVGMVQRNEFNAIIAHGTMLLMRRTAIETAGGWSSDTICEDTDLGLRMLGCGWGAHYTNQRYGYGLLPDSFQAYKSQRHRWAYGGFQILKKNWRCFLPGTGGLTAEQKREFSFGWLGWLGSETLGTAVTILNIMWVPGIAFLEIAIPDGILTVPILASFVISVAHFLTLYRLRVSRSIGRALGSLWAAMSMQWTIARAVALGLLGKNLPFVRTNKGGHHRHSDFHAFAEAVIASLLIASATLLVAINQKEIREIYVFAVVLMVQSLPYIAAIGMAVIERTRFNEFAYWRGLRARLVELRRRGAMIARSVKSAFAPKHVGLARPPNQDATGT
jgi:exo-beta-1,3-glucanase (GH17 family)/cellulose synthase/poly-beta-1,6-N-acetylglucosamine synthase-like glycosyltransferase